MSEVKRFTGDFDRVTAERDVALAELKATKVRENLLLNSPNNVFKQMCDLALGQRDALQVLLTAADERADEQDRILRSSVPAEHKGCTSPVGAVQNYIADLEARIADFPEIVIQHCNFQGFNADGSEVLEFAGSKLIKNIKSFRMIGWQCLGPKPAEGGGDDRE